MIRDKLCSPSLRCHPESDGNEAKGKTVKFSGYWVSAAKGKIEVTAGEFDETDLSAHSDWKEASQNEDNSCPHGFLDPLTMLHDVSKRIDGQISDSELQKAREAFAAGAPCPVNDLIDLARLIQLAIPRSQSQLASKPSRTAQSDDGKNIPFD